MSQALHYKLNLRDLQFNLFEFLEIGRTALGKPPFGDLDEATARQTLETLAPIAVNELAASFAEGDHTPLTLKDGEVTLPKGIRKALDTYFEAGMHTLNLPPHLGGVGAPPSLTW